MNKSINWKRIQRYGRRAGKEAMAIVEATYLTLFDREIAYKHKSILIGALVYFVSPIDAAPDFLPGGFADDIYILLAALYATGEIGKKHLRKCRIKNGAASQPKDEDFAPIDTTSKKS